MTMTGGGAEGMRSCGIGLGNVELPVGGSVARLLGVSTVVLSLRAFIFMSSISSEEILLIVRTPSCTLTVTCFP